MVASLEALGIDVTHGQHGGDALGDRPARDVRDGPGEDRQPVAGGDDDDGAATDGDDDVHEIRPEGGIVERSRQGGRDDIDRDDTEPSAANRFHEWPNRILVGGGQEDATVRT